MFGWISGILGKVAVGISSVLIGVAGFVSPAPKTESPQLPIATTTVEEKVVAVSTETIKKDTPIPTVQIPQTVSKQKSTTSITLSPQIVSEPDVEISNVRVIPSTYSATIKWTTNVASDGMVTYWPVDGSGGNLVATTKDKTEHQVDVTANQAKSYYYIIEVTTKVGKTAASEQKQFTTLHDVTTPLILSAKLSRSSTSGSLMLIVKTNEPTKLQVKYTFQYVMEDIIERQITTKEFNTVETIPIPLPDGGWNENTLIHYSINAYDQAGNATSSEKYSVSIAGS